MSTLLAELQALEVELHHPGVACDFARLEELLHTDFHEVGRSGRRYDRATVLHFLSEREVLPEERWQLLYHQGTPTTPFA
jgi:hypothetical protein